MVGFFALFQLDFNLTAIAALLTIVGYSVNDKVVVYDRMRENMRLYKKMALRQLVDMSINQVLIRCIFTSTTTVLAMLPMAIWGGSAVHNFAIPMVVGVVIATSSSIFCYSLAIGGIITMRGVILLKTSRKGHKSRQIKKRRQSKIKRHEKNMKPVCYSLSTPAFQ